MQGVLLRTESGFLLIDAPRMRLLSRRPATGLLGLEPVGVNILGQAAWMNDPLVCERPDSHLESVEVQQKAAADPASLQSTAKTLGAWLSRRPTRRTGARLPR